MNNSESCGKRKGFEVTRIFENTTKKFPLPHGERDRVRGKKQEKSYTPLTLVLSPKGRGKRFSPLCVIGE